MDGAVRAVRDAGYVEPGNIAVVLAGSPGEPDLVSDTLRLVRIR